MGEGFKFSSFKTDKALEEEGVWIDYGQGFRMKIARLGNSKCQAYLRRLRKPFMRQIQAGTLDDAVAESFLRKAVGKFVLLGWEGMCEDDGTEIPFSAEEAMKRLETRDFLELVVEIAQDRETFKEEIEGDAAKN